MSTSVEHPPAHPLRRWVLDVVVALLVAAATVPAVMGETADDSLVSGRGTGAIAAPGGSVALAVLVVAALALPLLLRRTAPRTVFAWTFVVTAVWGVAEPSSSSGLAVLVALYTVAAWCSRRSAVVCGIVLEAAALAAATVDGAIGFWLGALFLSGLVAAALGLGLFTATRRAYLAELRDRAERLMHERDQQGELAAAAERSRIAREIHDIVAHHLTVIVALSDGAVAASAASPARAAEVMRTVSATGREALTDTRRLLGVLRDDRDGESGVHHPAPDLHELDALIERVRGAGLPVVHEVQGSAGTLAPGLQLTAYRLVQEALTNTLKHAGTGASATVRLRHSADELAVEVSDDGAGRRVATVGAGRGLVGMRERVSAFGGTVSAGPRPGGGWVVAARLPLDGSTPVLP